MAVKNSEVRQFAVATQVEPEKRSFSMLAALLVIIVPAAGMYAYRSGMLNSLPLPAPIKAMLAPQAAPAPAPAAIPAATPALTQAEINEAATKAKKREQLARGAKLAFDLHMNPELLEEFFGSIGAMMDEGIGKNKRVINPDDLFAFCREQTRNLVRDRAVLRRENKSGNEMFDVVSEGLYCVMTRRPQRLCEPELNGRLVKRLKAYFAMRDGAMSEFVGDPVATAAGREQLDRGVHREIVNEVKKLGSRGVISINSFGWFPTATVKETLGPFKGTKSACDA